MLTFAVMKQLLFTLITIICCACSSTRCGYVATSGGGRIFYEERGKGDAVLLLHGHSLDRRMWDDQWTVLGKHFRTIRMDFRGYGRSSDQHESLQMTHADDVLTLMDTLHIRQAHVVGLSMGAFVAGDLLAMHPERLLSCTMASGGIRNSKGPSEPMDSAESRKRDKEIAALRVKGVEQMKREWTEQLIASGGSHRERMRTALNRMITEWTAWQPLHKEVRLFYGREAWQRLRQRGMVSVPTLMIRGANELKGKQAKPRELSFTSNGRYIVIDDCGHMLNMERPHEFNAALIQFLLSK